MNPHQKNKVDINVRSPSAAVSTSRLIISPQAMSPDEQRLFRMYGKLPDKKNLLQNKLKGQERKYFDSGDYALSKAGKAGDVGVTSIGVEHPSPDTIPHLSSSPNTQTPGNPNGNPSLNLQPTTSHQSYVSGSPVKESSILQRGMSVDDQDGDVKSAMEKRAQAASSSLSPSSESDAVPIRQ
ncbi:Endosulfine-domain-containing protein [Aureobasidium sp. EXF-10727]|nr:Endosulfine-domain-containing protein [Aureobasidium sp. EXF-10727]